ncbi:MAG: glycosyltransferase, partial [Thermoanaerobaculia bacterium]
ASSVGGVPEIVDPGVTGQLVPPGDPAALAAAITAVLTVAGSMKDPARRMASSMFSTQAWLSRLDTIYESVNRSPNPPALMPKIAFIEFAGKGGMIHYAFQLCRGMSALGADVTLVTSKDYELEHVPSPFKVERLINLWDPKPAGKLSMAPWAIAGRKIRRLFRAARYYGQWLRVTRYIAETRPDIVLLGDIRFPFDFFPLLLLRRKARILTDICHNVHPFAAGGKAGGLFDRSKFKEFFYRRIYRLFDQVFVHYPRNRSEFTSSFGIPEKRVGVIVHGNEEIFRDLHDKSVDASVLRKRLGIGADEPVVLFFGTLSRYKGTDVLLQAFPAIRAKTNARLVLAGFPFHDFNLAEHRELTRSLGIGDAVTWVPEYIATEEVAAWMELASVVVFPYRDIYQSGALHVPQTFGVPIVASAVGAMQDVVQHGVSGLLVPPENAGALADAVTTLLQDRALAARLGARAAADAQGPFSWSSIAQTILKDQGYAP